MLRVGVTQRVEALPDRDERRDCLDQAWMSLLAGVGMVAVPIPNRIADVGDFVEGLGLAGAILSGGNDLADLPGADNTAPERDALERAILERSAETGLPVLGVCRGLQLMTVHFGGRLTPIEDHVRVHHPVTIEDAGPLELVDREGVNSYHDWGVRVGDIGNVLRVAAVAPDGSVEALRHPELPQAAIMWHPERGTTDPRDAALIARFFGAPR
jgi:putative glutamine amidotransferase